MRTWVDLNPPKDFDPRLVEMFKRINLYMQQSNVAFAKLGRGETPDGGSAPITPNIDLRDYFKLSGRSGGQVGYGGINSGDDLTFSSTSHATKGDILFGASAIYKETDSLFGSGTTSPEARLHGVAKIGSLATLLPSSDIANNWAGPYTGSGGSPGSGAFWQNISTSDDDTSYIGILESPVNGTNPQVCGLGGTVPTGQPWIITVRVRGFTTLGGGSTIQVRLRDSVGNEFGPATAVDISGVGTSWTTKTMSIDGAGVPTATGQTPNSIAISASGGTNYVLLTYVSVDLDVTGTYAEAGRFDAIATTGNNVLSVRDTGADPLFRVLDNAHIHFEDGAGAGAYLLGASNALTIADITSGKGLKFDVSGITASTIRTITVPNAAGTLGLLEQSQTWTGASNVFDDSGGSGAAIETVIEPSSGSYPFQLRTSDDSTTVFGVNSAGDVEIFSLAFYPGGVGIGNKGVYAADSLSGTRLWVYPNLSGHVVLVGDDTPAVASGNLGKVSITGRTTAIGSTNLTSSPPAALYELQVYLACTTASGSGAPTLDVNVAWTDVVGATNTNVIAAFPLSATGRTQARLLAQVSSGNISYSTTINAASGSPQYAIYVRVVALG